MSRNDLNTENLFRTRMEAFKVEPSPGLWKKLHARILWKQFLSFGFRKFNIYTLAAAVSIMGAGVWILLGGRDSSVQRQALPVPAETEAVSPSVPELSEARIAEKTPQETQGKGEKEPGTAIKAGIQKAGETGKEDDVAGKTSGNRENKSGKRTPNGPASGSREDHSKKAESLIVSAGFTADNPSGCSPLPVSFMNLSENAVKYNWTFGDGGNSADKNPSYVFDEPGEYQVVLKILGADGREYTAGQTILVHETPKALFEMDEGADPASGQPVYFYNYSRGADFYAWDFGDRQQSNLEEPIHFYEKPGSYDVKLKVWTVNQCYDSLIIRNAFTGPENSILFPTAFTPNLTGPTGGYYDATDLRNTVFHPVVSGELAEYQLKIFNRQGVLVFESKEVSIGWDGYYHEKLAAQAVYIWKARGKFINGQTFVKSGDVTLLRQY